LRSRTLLVCAILLCVGVSGGCKKKEGAPAPTGPAPTGGADAPKGTTPAPAEAGILDPRQVTNGGSVAGTIKLDGPAPAQELVDMSQKPECVQLHGDKGTPKDTLVAGTGLADVFVYVKKGLENYKFAVPTDPAVIDQKGCMYAPHVFGIIVNQDLKILNSDPFSHNVKNNDIQLNLGMAKGDPPQVKPKAFKKEQVPTVFQCDVHAWMKAFACVVKHPYYMVTKNDGKFEIKNLPAGKYTLAVWHERARGLTDPAPAEVEIEIKSGETVTKDFTYAYKP
jgi:hypothetical protein